PSAAPPAPKGAHARPHGQHPRRVRDLPPRHGTPRPDELLAAFRTAGHAGTDSGPLGYLGEDETDRAAVVAALRRVGYPGRPVVEQDAPPVGQDLHRVTAHQSADCRLLPEEGL
ncbi:hypothetical protein, partial [Streptomyces sp. PU-14G]|uniref:hypothetical protein n=1 Tax=Streptomyces sp. PU-14G TaxID=2800808 RepID=UPI0034DF932F